MKLPAAHADGAVQVEHGA
jgi:hypothetical protein